MVLFALVLYDFLHTPHDMSAKVLDDPMNTSSTTVHRIVNQLMT